MKLVASSKWYISIHAPARGATGALLGISSANYKFQSTPPRGGRHSYAFQYCNSLTFQSTPREGGDR